MAREEYAKLESFLADPRRPAATMRYHELQGFLFTVASSPEPIEAPEWIPIVFDEQEPGYESLDEQDAIVGALIRLYGDVYASVGADRPALPPDCAFAEDPLESFGNEAPIGQWARGFLAGHQWLEEIWAANVSASIDEEYSMVLLALSFFASRELGEDLVRETRAHDLARLAASMKDAMPEAAADYAHLGRAMRAILQDPDESQPARSTKIGRNEPCPCGSGRKYKKCCGAPA